MQKIELIKLNVYIQYKTQCAGRHFTIPPTTNCALLKYHYQLRK